MIVQLEDLMNLVRRHFDQGNYYLAMRTLNIVAKEAAKRLTEAERIEFALETGQPVIPCQCCRDHGCSAGCSCRQVGDF